MDLGHFQPLLQWLRRQAVHETVSKIAPSGSLFWQHLQSLIWGCLRFAVCVPRDYPTVSEALEKLGFVASSHYPHLCWDLPRELCN